MSQMQKLGKQMVMENQKLVIKKSWKNILLKCVGNLVTYTGPQEPGMSAKSSRVPTDMID